MGNCCDTVLTTEQGRYPSYQVTSLDGPDATGAWVIPTCLFCKSTLHDELVFCGYCQCTLGHISCVLTAKPSRCPQCRLVTPLVS